VRLAGQAGVERAEQPGRAEQERWRGGAALLVKGDLPAQVLHLCGAKRVGRAGPGSDQQPQCRIEGTLIVLDLRRGEHPLRPAGRVGCQQCRTLQERRRGGEAAAVLGPARRAFQLRGDLFIRPGGGLRPVPGTPVRVQLRIGGLRQRAVYLLPVLQ